MRCIGTAGRTHKHQPLRDLGAGVLCSSRDKTDEQIEGGGFGIVFGEFSLGAVEEKIAGGFGATARQRARAAQER